MAPPSVGIFKRLWYSWKALDLPWRRQHLRGYDLSGITFWEFRDALSPNGQTRFRRIARYPRRTRYADVAISPAWTQWLRHTRETPPTLHEQQSEVQRQVQIKELAALADERWRSQERFADRPGGVRGALAGVGAAGTGEAEGVKKGAEGHLEGAQEGPGRRLGTKQARDNPWEKHKKVNPSERWQPEAWQPPSRKT